MRELLIGCGSRREKNVILTGESLEWSDLTTLDNNIDHNPDVLHDLEDLPYPFQTDYFDEIHAYEVLEHLGSQGDWQFFFDQFSEIHRILTPGGHFYATVPHHLSPWAWGDPSHKRVIPLESLVFLNQAEYEQVGHSSMSDFRFYYKADFKVIFSTVKHETSAFVLEAIK